MDNFLYEAPDTGIKTGATGSSNPPAAQNQQSRDAVSNPKQGGTPSVKPMNGKSPKTTTGRLRRTGSNNNSNETTYYTSEIVDHARKAIQNIYAPIATMIFKVMTDEYKYIKDAYTYASKKKQQQNQQPQQGDQTDISSGSNDLTDTNGGGV